MLRGVQRACFASLRRWPYILAAMLCCLFAAATPSASPADDPLLERVTATSKKQLQSLYKNEYKAIVVDSAARTSTGAEVKGRIIWKEGCPAETRWHFIFSQSGVIDKSQSIISRGEDIRRCYEAATPRSVPRSTLDTDAFVRRANATCETAVRQQMKVPVVRVWTEEVLRFGDGGVNLRGYLETATLSYGWVCKVGLDGGIRSGGKDVMLVPRRSVDK